MLNTVQLYLKLIPDDYKFIYDSKGDKITVIIFHNGIILTDVIDNYDNLKTWEKKMYDIYLIKKLNITGIIKMISNYYSVDILLNTNKRKIVQPRQIAMYFAKKLTKLTLADIGFEIGKKNHATVLHAIKTVNNLIDTNKIVRQDILTIEKIFKNEWV